MNPNFISDQEMEKLVKSGKAQIPNFISDEEANKIFNQEQQQQISKSRSIPTQFATGVAKGLLETGRNVGKFGQEIAQQTSGRVVNAIRGRGFVATDDIGSKFLEGERPEALTPQTLAEKLGYGVENIAEYLVPVSKVAKAEKAVSNIISGINKIPKLAKIALNIGSKAAIEGGVTGAIRTAQTGDVEQGKEAAITAGTLSGAVGFGGEVLKGLKVPEKLYSRIFKENYKDFEDAFKSKAITEIQTKNPDYFNQLLQSGIIKQTSNGSVKLNTSLARQALDKGLKGSVTNMADEIVKDTFKTELLAQNAVKSYVNPLKMEPQYTNILKSISDDYADVGFGEVTRKANELMSKISNGETTAENMLDIRRFLDGVRLSRSFDVPTNKLSMSQQNLKSLTDRLRQRLATEVPGLGRIMSDYKFNIDALESLSREAARRNNRDPLGLINSIFLGEAITAPSLNQGIQTGIIGGIRNAATNPRMTTNIAQSINKSEQGMLGAGVQGATALTTQPLSPEEEYLNSLGI